MGVSLGRLFDERDNNINLMRLVAALCVIYGHAGAVTGAGEPDIFLRLIGYKFIGGVAVDVFFVLSGFLIAASAENTKGMLYYVASRVLRIYPALFVCVLLTVCVLGPLLSDSSSYWGQTVWRYFVFNASALRTEYFLPGVFDQLHDKAVNGSLWSLPVEVRMYVMVFALACLGIVQRRVLFNVVFFVVMAIGYFQPAIFQPFLLHDSHLHVCGMFMIGMFCWVNRFQLPVSVPLLFFMLVYALTLKGAPNFGLAYAVVLPYLVFCLAFLPGLAWFNKLGDYSYGVYLYGWISQQSLMLAWPSMSTLQNAFWGSVVALVLGIASWYLVEKPSLRAKKYFARLGAQFSFQPERV